MQLGTDQVYVKDIPKDRIYTLFSFFSLLSRLCRFCFLQFVSHLLTFTWISKKTFIYAHHPRKIDH